MALSVVAAVLQLCRNCQAGCDCKLTNYSKTSICDWYLIVFGSPILIIVYIIIELVDLLGIVISKYGEKQCNRSGNASQRPSTNVIIHPSIPPLPFPARMILEGVVYEAPEAVRVAVEQLVVKSWNETWTGVGRDATGLSHSRIQVRNVWIIYNYHLKSRYNAGFILGRLRNVETTQEQTQVLTSQIFSTIPDLPRDVFTFRHGEQLLLFHGTPRKNAPIIIQHGYKSAKNCRSPYGKGTYGI